MVPPAPLVLLVRVMALPTTDAVAPWALITLLIWLAMSFLVAAALVFRLTLTAVPLTTRFKVLLLGLTATGPALVSVLVTLAATALPAVMSTLIWLAFDAWPLIENCSVAEP